MNTLFTIGHSNHELSRFIELLRQHSIDAVADVRSQPFSGRLPQFNRPVLEKALTAASIKYSFLGAELGARREEAECYDGHHARYELVAITPAFKKGLQRVIDGLARYHVVLMCAEKDPLTCHRTILVCRHLKERVPDIQHILADGTLESHAAAERRLLDQFGLAEPSLFATPQQQLDEAYQQQGEKISFRAEEEPEVAHAR